MRSFFPLRLFGTSAATTRHAFWWAERVRQGRRPSMMPTEPHRSFGPEDTALHRNIGATEVLVGEIMRIGISVLVLGFGLYFLIAGSDDAAQWAAGALGAVVGYWLR